MYLHKTMKVSFALLICMGLFITAQEIHGAEIEIPHPEYEQTTPYVPAVTPSPPPTLPSYIEAIVIPTPIADADPPTISAEIIGVITNHSHDRRRQCN
ncbi:MAG: hypothetical protein FWC89_10880 [Defluviitaleaceae bacterium]|nr:hypothetical protein [Defluviitaleaceae bacterium]